MTNLVFAGILSAIFSYILNKLMLIKLQERALIALIPFIEEMAKTTFALLFTTSIIGVHFVFGVIEGIYDLIFSSKKIGKWAALASLISHSFFGGITYVVFEKTNVIILSILVAWIFHSTWNWFIMEKL